MSSWEGDPSTVLQPENSHAASGTDCREERVFHGRNSSAPRVFSQVGLRVKHSSLPGSSVHGILQARILEWLDTPFSRGSSRPRKSNQGLLHCRQMLYQLRYQRSFFLTIVSFYILKHYCKLTT